MKKLAIVGAHRSTRDDAPYFDDDYDVWIIARHAVSEWALRFDAVIDIHTAVLDPHPKSPGYWKFLQTTDIPVYMLVCDHRVKSAVQYPSEVAELLQNIRHNGNPVEMFSSTVDYAIGLAIHLGYKQIDLYGIEMNNTTDGEYEYQRPGLMLWMGIAAGNGAVINIHCISKMFHTEYGNNLLRYMLRKDKRSIKFESRSDA